MFDEQLGIPDVQPATWSMCIVDSESGSKMTKFCKQNRINKERNTNQKENKTTHNFAFSLLFCMWSPGRAARFSPLHPTRRIVCSASFSWNFQGSFWGCAKQFGDYLGVILKGFRKENYSTSKRKNCKNLVILLFKITLDSLLSSDLDENVSELVQKRRPELFWHPLDLKNN